MPRKPEGPCPHPGYPELVDRRFCKKHEKEYNGNYEKYKKDPRTHKCCGKAWRLIRKRYVSEHSLCEMCLKENKMIKVEEVRHILPLSHGGTNDEDNLMGLCKSCHSKIHAKSGGRFGG